MMATGGGISALPTDGGGPSKESSIIMSESTWINKALAIRIFKPDFDPGLSDGFRPQRNFWVYNWYEDDQDVFRFSFQVVVYDSSIERRSWLVLEDGGQDTGTGVGHHNHDEVADHDASCRTLKGHSG